MPKTLGRIHRPLFRSSQLGTPAPHCRWLGTRARFLRRGASALVLTVLIWGGRASPAQAQQPEEMLYRVQLIQAAPGGLLELIDLQRDWMVQEAAAGFGPVFTIRHSQGDHWDLFVISPAHSFQDYFASDAMAARAAAVGPSGVPRTELEARMLPLVSWREDLFVHGPDLETFQARMSSGNYYHVEMFIALAGKREELLREREMENAYQAGIGRPTTMIFSRAGGASWDSFTIGVYDDLQHYADRTGITPEMEEASAIAAGFQGAAYIGAYMRTLIASHNDTLGGGIR
jgi:hypothetical protein